MEKEKYCVPTCTTLKQKESKGGAGIHSIAVISNSLIYRRLMSPWCLFLPDKFIFYGKSFQVSLACIEVMDIFPHKESSPSPLDLWGIKAWQSFFLITRWLGDNFHASWFTNMKIQMFHTEIISQGDVTVFSCLNVSAFLLVPLFVSLFCSSIIEKMILKMVLTHVNGIKLI